MAFIRVLYGKVPLVKSIEASLLKLRIIEDWGNSVKIELGNESCTASIILHKQELLEIVKQLNKQMREKHAQHQGS